MLYSNITPPDFPVYDTETYSHYLLVFNYSLGSENWYHAVLLCSRTPFYYSTEGGYVTTDSSYLRYVCDKYLNSDNTSWTEYGELDNTPTLKPGQNDNVYQRIWTSETLLNTERRVWLKANKATVVWDATSFWIGLALGLAGSSLPPINRALIQNPNILLSLDRFLLQDKNGLYLNQQEVTQ